MTLQQQIQIMQSRKIKKYNIQIKQKINYWHSPLKDNIQMGTSVTIDKHGTSLQDWIQIQDKLTQVQFNANPNNHLMLWRIFVDQIDQTVNCVPLLLENVNPVNAFNNQQAYVVGLVKKSDYQEVQNTDFHVISILNCLNLNINTKSLQTCMKKCSVEDGSNKFQYFTYAYLGKRAKNNVKMAALSYCYKLNALLNNPQRIKVITGGGVFRNKKLQMGSVIPLVKKKNSINKNLNEYKNIHIVSQLTNKFSNQGSQNRQSYPNRQFSIFNYKPKLAVPSTSTGVIIQHRKSTMNSQHSSNSQKVNVPSLKPPMLKLALKPYEDVTYEQVDEEQKNQKFDIRATARHELKMQKFGVDCSMIVEGLYLSGEKVAKDQQMLKKYKIVDIINCAGDYCPNWFESVKQEQNPGVNKYNYLTFFLKDSQNQNIQCLFYRVIDFINKALNSKRNVLVHCIQGISRSVTFVIAYLIFTNGYDYKKAQSFVKDRRGIACPNNGFMVQLIQFHKRLHQKYTSLFSPRVFLVSFHCQQTPDIITARLIKQKLFEPDGKKYIGLDQRAIYIIQSQQILYLWVGNKCDDEKKMKLFWNYAQVYIKKLQQNQKAPMKVKAIHQGNEGRDFLSLWNLQQLPKQYTNSQYDRLFNEQKPTPKPGYLRKHYQREQDLVEQQYLSKLFIYPDYQNGLGVFELEDLSGFCLLIKSDNEKIKVFVWKASDWEAQNNSDEQFLDNVIKSNYASYPQENISVVEQQGVNQPENLSEQFLNCFS